jgi:multidrug resistance efflux pump
VEALLLGIYSFFVWLIFIKFKWLPWNKVSQITVVIIPIVALTALILCLNVFAPSTTDVRVIKYVVQVVPQVRGRVTEVPVAPNSDVRKGDVLFRIDPTPFELQVQTLEAQLAATEGSVDQLNEQARSAAANTEAVRSKLDLARKRVVQNRELATTGAGDRFALEQAEADLAALEAELNASVAAEAQVRARLLTRASPPRRW